mgnify:CR=1 FL=1
MLFYKNRYHAYGQDMARKPNQKANLKTEAIAVRLDPDLKDRARQAAAVEQRTLSQWVEMLIRAAVENKR